MKIKTQLTLASVIAAGLLASGCSSQQLIAQPSAPAVVDTVVNTVSVPAPVTTVTETMTNTVVDCSKCNRPAPRPQPRPQNNNMHSHPAVHGCSAAVQHAHPRPQGGQHNHRYGCNKQQVKKPVQRPTQRANPNAHTHPAIPNCTKSVRHVHPNGSRGHNHRYSCQRPLQAQQPVQRPVYRPQPVQRPVYRPQPVQQPMPVMPKVKAKGTYRGPIKIDGMMQQYQQ